MFARYALSTLVTFVFLVVGAEGEGVCIAGSDFFKGVIEGPIEAFYNKKEKHEVTFSFTGSYLAMQALEAGEADLAIMAIPDSAQKPSDNLWALKPFAFQAPVVVVNAKNPLEEISLKNLYFIYGTNNLVKWSDLGLEGEWQHRSVQAVAIESRSGDDFVNEIFKVLVLRGECLSATMAFCEDVSGVEKVLQNKNESMALLRYLPTSKTLKSVSLVKGDKGNDFAYLPTEESIYYGDYPVRLPYYIVYEKKKEKKLNGILSYLIKDEGIRNRLKEKDFFVVPKKNQKSLLQDLDIE